MTMKVGVQSRLWVDDLNTKSLTSGQTTKVIYEWMVSTLSCLRVDRRLKSPTGGQSKH